MEITDIRIRRIDSEGKMKAVVSVTFDNEFVVHDIKIIESQSGLFIAMPSRKTPSGEFRDIAHPIHSEARSTIQSAILEDITPCWWKRKQEQQKKKFQWLKQKNRFIRNRKALADCKCLIFVRKLTSSMDDFQLLRFSFICRNNWGECLTTRYAVLDR